MKISRVFCLVGGWWVNGSRLMGRWRNCWWVGLNMVAGSVGLCSVVGRSIEDLLVDRWSVVEGQWVNGGPIGGLFVVCQWSVAFGGQWFCNAPIFTLIDTTTAKISTWKFFVQCGDVYTFMSMV